MAQSNAHAVGLSHLMGVMSPDQQLFRDLNRQHQEIALGCCYQAIRAKLGRDVSVPMLKKHFGLIKYEHGRFMEFTWKKEVIVRVHAPQVMQNNANQLVQHRSIELVWKKRPGSV